MVINNWFLTIDMYGAVMEGNLVPYLFFFSFWCFVVLILLNVIIALIIEIYSSVEPEVELQCQRIKMSLELDKMVKSVEGKTLKEKITQVKH